MLVARKPRRSASPLLTVAMLARILEEWLSGRPTRDVSAHLAPLQNDLSWKKAFGAELLEEEHMEKHSKHKNSPFVSQKRRLKLHRSSHALTSSGFYSTPHQTEHYPQVA